MLETSTDPMGTSAVTWTGTMEMMGQKMTQRSHERFFGVGDVMPGSRFGGSGAVGRSRQSRGPNCTFTENGRTTA